MKALRFLPVLVFLIGSAQNAWSSTDQKIHLRAYYLKKMGSLERIPAWAIDFKNSEKCESTLNQINEKAVPLKLSEADCSTFKLLRESLVTEFKTLSTSSDTEGSSHSLLHYEIEFQGTKRPVVFQAPRRCKIDVEGNEVECVDFKLSASQKILNILRPKAVKSNSHP